MIRRLGRGLTIRLERTADLRGGLVESVLVFMGQWPAVRSAGPFGVGT